MNGFAPYFRLNPNKGLNFEMIEPFIRNHQYNHIKKHIDYLQRTCETVTDPRVVASVRSNAEAGILGLFPNAEESQLELLAGVAKLWQADEFQQYLRSAESCLTAFPPITEKQIRKLFPKAKKLPIPDLSGEVKTVTYLGWTDISTNKMFLVYPLDGELVGIEGKFTPTNKKGICFLCNRHEETALFTAVTKTRPTNASPDYYKAVGNYLCLDSHACNNNITDVEPLERYIRQVIC